MSRVIKRKVEVVANEYCEDKEDVKTVVCMEALTQEFVLQRVWFKFPRMLPTLITDIRRRLKAITAETLYINKDERACTNI